MCGSTEIFVLAKNLKAYLVILAGVLVVGCNRPDADSIIEAAQQHIAGSEEFPGISKIYIHAECTGPDGPFQTQIWSTTEGFVRFEQYSSRDTTIAGISDTKSWMRDDNEISDIDLSNEVFLHSHELHLIAIDPLSRLANPTYMGKSEFKAQQADRIQFLDGLNNHVDIYYRLDDPLPIGMKIRNPFDREGEHIQILFENWKRLDNGLFFFTEASFQQGEDVWRYEYTAIEIDNFDESVFSTSF